MTRPGGPVARRALVTGGSRGLGMEIGLGLARAGYSVALNGRTGSVLERTRSEMLQEALDVISISGDASVDAQRIVSEAAGRLGGLDVVIHAAGVRDRRITSDLDTQAFSDLLGVNLTSGYAIARQALPLLRQSSAGRLIFVTSIAASIARPGDPAYAAAKGGLAALARSLAVEFAAQNLTVNAIAPGLFLTEANRSLADDPAIATFLNARVPVRRWGRPEEIVPAALFLASPDASYVNGTTITVDGGLSAKM
ncbi:SDR family oxidoreductase [Thalassobaculum sp.]|uniref:SDR family NAD(P)-dependent oxidoreductase n=1 Tax=Thalassobaculum sp. TaxID=2022740 RepID=UPI0032EE8E32